MGELLSETTRPVEDRAKKELRKEAATRTPVERNSAAEMIKKKDGGQTRAQA